MSDRKLAVGWFDNMPFQHVCAPHLERLKEVFFAWPGVTASRPMVPYRINALWAPFASYDSNFALARFHQLPAPNLLRFSSWDTQTNKKRHNWRFFICGVPSRTRTCNLLLRRQLLYPIEPWARIVQVL